MKNEQTPCFVSMFPESDVAAMMTKATTPLNKPKQLCYE